MNDPVVESLKNRWKGHEKELQGLIDIIRTDPGWYKSEAYKTLMVKLPSPPKEVGAVEKDLRGANLSKSDLHRADLSEANLRWANLSGAYLGRGNLSGAWLQGVKYTKDEVFNRLINWWGPQILSHIPVLKKLKKWKPIGITKFDSVDHSRIDGSTNPILKRHIEDYQFIQAFRDKSPLHRWLFYPLWKITSDCGRSLLLWFLWSIGFVSLFTRLYSRHLDWFQQTKLDWFNTFYLA